jgi:hypothetical protein
VTSKTPDIIEFTTDAQLLGLALSPAQETLLRGIYGLTLTPDQRELWTRCTGRDTYAGKPYGEVTVLAGARSGKDSRIAAPVLLYEALYGGHAERLGRGETAMIPCVAQDARAAKIAFQYLRDYLTTSPELEGAVDEVLASEVRLTNRVTLATFACTLRGLRGWSIAAAVLDELGFFRLEGQADSDVEIQTSVRRGMLNFPAPRLVKISTPYLKAGILYEDWRDAYGKDNPDRLVWVAPSVLMNPTLSDARMERERRLDPQRFAREYEAVWQDDLAAFLPGAWVEAAVVSGRHELPAVQGIAYGAAVDASGGSGRDAFTLAIVHTEGKGTERRVVQDVMKAWKGDRSGSVDLEGIVAEAAAELRRYGVRKVHGDRYSAQWVRQAFSRHGIQYADPEIRGTYVDRSRAYLESESLFAQGRIALLDHPALVRELRGLEKRLKPGGRATVDHPQAGHDDHANALALAATMATQRLGDSGVTIGAPDPTARAFDGGLTNPAASWERAIERQVAIFECNASSNDHLPAGWEDPENWC